MSICCNATSNPLPSSEVILASTLLSLQVNHAAGLGKGPKGLYYLALMNLEGKGAIQDFEKGKKFALASASFNYEAAYNQRWLGLLRQNSAFRKVNSLRWRDSTAGRPQMSRISFRLRSLGLAG
jgi:hypothetical protein